MSAVVVHESGARPYAIGDNTIRRSYFPTSAKAAIALATSLLQRGHDLDLGYAQINSANLRPYHLTVARAFDACTNVATASRILGGDYAGARRRFGPGQAALAHALSAYNSGGYYARLGYARDVYATAATLRYERSFGIVHARFTSGRAVAFRRGSRAVVAK